MYLVYSYQTACYHDYIGSRLFVPECLLLSNAIKNNNNYNNDNNNEIENSEINDANQRLASKS